MERKKQTSNAEDLRDIFLTGLKDIYWAEQSLTKKLPEIEAKAFDVRLKTAIKDHLAQLKKAFYSLTPGRQKGYLFYFNQAKQSRTREARIEKHYQQILDGKGLGEK